MRNGFYDTGIGQGEEWDPIFDDYLGDYDYPEMGSWLSEGIKTTVGSKTYSRIFKPIEEAFKPVGKILTPVAEFAASFIPGVGPLLQTSFGQTLIYGEKAVQRAAQYGISPAEAAAASSEISKAEKEARAAGQTQVAQQLAAQRQALMAAAAGYTVPAPGTDKTMIYIIAAVAVLALLFFMKKKK